MCVFDSNFYILSKNQIFVFTPKGSFVRSYNLAGIGPHEYLEIADFDIKNGKLMINDREGRKLLSVDIKSNSVDVINHGLFSYNFLLKNNLLFLNSGNLYNENSKYSVNIIDINDLNNRGGCIEQDPNLAYLSVVEYRNFSEIF